MTMPHRILAATWSVSGIRHGACTEDKRGAERPEGRRRPEHREWTYGNTGLALAARQVEWLASPLLSLGRFGDRSLPLLLLGPVGQTVVRAQVRPPLRCTDWLAAAAL